MSYIRTKDGVYKVVFVSPLGFVRIDKRDGTYPDVFEKDIIKQADTVEELCDDVVVKYQNQLPIPERIKNLKECMELNHITWEEHFNWLFKRFKEKLEWVKLAIYTDKGLIYVAKMNEEGELELLCVEKPKK